jgi:hypothetical protein
MRWYSPKVNSLVLLSFLLIACTVSLISPYNSKLVKNLNVLQNNINTILEGGKQDIHQPRSDYTKHASTYTKLNASLNTVISEVRAIPNSQTTLRQLRLLAKSLKEIQQLHQKGFKKLEVITILQDSINNEFTAIYKLQYAKKQLLIKE